MANLCETRRTNTGISSCDVKMASIRYVIFANTKHVIPFTAEADLFTKLQEDAWVTDADLRIYPINKKIEQSVNNSTDPTTGSLDSGYEEQTAPGRQIMMFEWPSRFELDKVLNQFNDMDFGVYLVDNNNLLWGKTFSGADGLMPFPVYISVKGGGMYSSSAITTKQVTIDFGSLIEFQKSRGVMKFSADDNLETLVGLTDISIVGEENNVITFSVTNNGAPIPVELDTAIKEPTNWKVVDMASGASFEPTAVDATPDSKGYELTMPKEEAGFADGNYQVSVNGLESDGYSAIPAIVYLEANKEG